MSTTNEKPLRIVFDIDGTLGKAFPYEGNEAIFAQIQKSPKLSGRLAKLYLREDVRGVLYEKPILFFFLFRKGAREIIKLCERKWGGSHVYTAARYGYGKDIIKAVYRGRKLPKLFYSFEECRYDETKNIVKPLMEMLKEDKEVDESRILIIDDTAYTFRFNKENAVHIPPYNPSLDINELEADNDICLFKLAEFFEKIDSNTDVRTVQKESIF